ncbi:MAG: glycosyltransferase family 4 protein [Alphaproteobacteria bacterium]|nr:glycosyltransferase family 4 protein [Alphaproteobacteria bacterium]
MTVDNKAISGDAQQPPAATTVCIISPGGILGRGGIARLVRYEVDAWDAGSNYRLWIVDSYGPRMRFAAMPFHYLYAVMRVLAGFRRCRLFHVHMATHGSSLREGSFVWLARLLGRPVVLHLHGSAFAGFDDWLPRPGRWMLRRLLNGAGRVIVIGQALKREATDRFGVPSDRITIIPNAVPDLAENDDSGTVTSCRITYLGRLEAKKGTPDLLAALSDTCLAELAWEAVLAGPGPLEPWRREVDTRGLDGRVRILAWQELDQVRRLLAGTDIFVLPSHGEVQSIALLEAMAAGCAVVATPVGAVPEAIIDEECGLLVAVGDAAALASALRRLVIDPGLRTRLGGNARQRQQTRFGIGRHCAEIVRTYDRLLADEKVESVQ